MKQIVIIALMLATVWGCSDDNGTNSKLFKTGEDFRIIKNMILRTEDDISLDTIGNVDLIYDFCTHEEKGVIRDFINVSHDEVAVIYGVRDSSEVSYKLETAKASQELDDAILKHFEVNIQEHETYLDSTIMTSRYRDSVNFDYIYLRNYKRGPYLLKMVIDGIEQSCVPIILITKPE